MENLIHLLNMKRKKDVESFCKDLTITSEEFANLILAGMAGLLEPYEHWRHHAQLEPNHLWPTEEEHKALCENGVGKLHGKALKMTTKMETLFEQRKLINVHLFYQPSKTIWHLFYFNQRDTASHANHWGLGPHIHYTHYSFLRTPLDEIVGKIAQPKPKFPKSIHIKYDRHHNRSE